MSLYTGMQDLSGARYTEANHSGDIIDLDVLRAARERGEALPTAGDPERDKFHGAVVFDPRAGVHRNVCYPDYSSLYPNIMRDCNASPDTIVGVGEEALWRSEYSRDELRWSYIDPRPVKHLDPDELFRDFTDGEYKMVYDPQSNTIKWRDDWSRVQEHLEPIYFLDPDIREGVLPSRADTYIRWNKSYEGTMYKATKRTRNCFSADTEVLTPDGVQNIRDLDVGDEVYSIDPETMEVEVKPVTETHHYPDANDDLVTFENSYVDLRVTPNHRMLARPEWERSRGYEFIEARELRGDYTLPSDWEYDGGERLDKVDLTDHADEYEVLVEPAVHGHTFADKLGFYPDRRRNSNKWDITSGYVLDQQTFEKNRETIEEYAGRMLIHSGEGNGWVPLRYDGDDVVELVGWFVTEGSARISERKEYESTTRGVTHTVQIAQQVPEHRDAIRSLLERMNLPYSEEDRSFTISNELWYDLLTGWCGDDSHDKRLPEWVFDMSAEQRHRLFETMVAGDGNDRGLRYTTASDDLRDDFMRLAMMEGRNPRYHRYEDVWRIRYGETNNTLRARDRGEATAEDGVYCVTVADNHTMLAGRNGKFQWVGQSLYGVSGDNNFRLFDWRVAEAITIGGRLLLEYGAETIIERLSSAFDESVVYRTHGDTDGFGIAVDEDVGRGHVLPRVQSAVEWLNDTGMPQFVEETFGVPEGETAHEVDLESYSPRLFIPSDDGTAHCELGTKKTYAERVTWEEGDECDEVHLTGVEAKRSDIADITENVQTDVLEAILYNEPLNAQKEVYERIRTAVARVRDGDAPLAELGKRSGMSKPPEEYGTPNRTPQPTYRGALYAKQHIDGEEEFDKPMKFPVARVHDPYPSTYTADAAQDGDAVDYIAVEDPSNIPSEIVIDREQIIEDTVKQPLEPILGTMGWKWDEAVHGHEQTGLNAFAEP